MQRLLSSNGYGAAKICEEIDRRWPLLKCQVDLPSGGGAILATAQLPFFLEGPEGRLEKAVRRAGSGKNKSAQVARPHHSTIISSLDGYMTGKLNYVGRENFACRRSFF